MTNQKLNPEMAAKIVYEQFMQSKGAEITTANGAKFWFLPSSFFDGGVNGIFVGCSKGGALVFQTPQAINKFACIRARFPSWAAAFVVETLRQLFILAGVVEAEDGLNKSGKSPVRKRKKREVMSDGRTTKQKQTRRKRTRRRQ